MSSPRTSSLSVSPAAPLCFPQPSLPAIDPDALERYRRVAEWIEHLCHDQPRPIRILDVGCNVLNLWPVFFDPEQVSIVRCDTLKASTDDPNYVQIHPQQPLPFETDAFDIVTSLEVLEHLPVDQRPVFLTECWRVCRLGAIWSCPDGHPLVEAAERFAQDCYADRNHHEHPFLREHRQHGLPEEAAIRGHLQALGASVTVESQAPLDGWLALILLQENLAEHQAGSAEQEALRAAVLSDAIENKAAFPGYRKFYIATHGARPSRLGPTHSGTVEEVAEAELYPAALRHLNRLLHQTEVGGQARFARERSSFEAALQRAEQEHARIVESWQQEREHWDRERELLQEEFQEAIRQRDAARRETLMWHLRTRVLDELVTQLSRRWHARLTMPLRWLRRKFIPLRKSETGLVCGPDVRPVGASETNYFGQPVVPGIDWEAVGPDPQLILVGLFPAGWARIQLRLRGEAQGRAEIYADFGEGFHPETRLESFDWVDQLNVDVVTYLPRMTRALRLDPIDGKGVFVLDSFQVVSLPPLQAAVHACQRKLELLRAYHCLSRTLCKGVAMLLTGRWGQVRTKLLQAFPDDRRLSPRHGFVPTSYDAWRRQHALSDEARQQMREEASAWEEPPLISLIMPTYDTPEVNLRAALDSILRQTYPHWQLCVTDDGSSIDKVRNLLQRYARNDPRIEVEFSPTNQGIAAASNRSLARARGRFIALVDHDDELAEHALFRVAQAIRHHPEADMLYSDEDKLTPDGRHIDPFFKPDWSPDYFLTCMYTCHLGVYRTEMARRVGGFRSAYDFAQDYDLALRIIAEIQRTSRLANGGSRESERIHHIPDILYHWRMVPNSTASGHEAKPEAEHAARRAVADYLKRIGKPGHVERGPSPGLQRVRYRLPGNPLISIIIPTASRRATIRAQECWMVAHCVQSIRRRSTYRNLEIVVVDNNDMPHPLAKTLDELEVRRVHYTDRFNLAQKINLGACHARGDYFLLMNDDMEVISPDWVESMLEYAQWPEIGLVGAKLFFENGNLQHAGVTFVGQLPFHHFYNQPGEHPGYWGGNVLVRNYSAVTGACTLMRRSIFEEIGGYDPAFPLNFNDIDFCMKVLDTHRRIVYQPNAQLYHYESVSKEGTFVEEIEAFLARWGDRWECDPLYNPHLTRTEYDYRIA